VVCSGKIKHSFKMLLRLQHGITKKRFKPLQIIIHTCVYCTNDLWFSWFMCCLITDVYLLGLLLFSLGMAS